MSMEYTTEFKQKLAAEDANGNRSVLGQRRLVPAP